MTIENKIISVNQFNCRGKKVNSFAFLKEEAQTVILRNYEDGKSIPLCPCLDNISHSCDYNLTNSFTTTNLVKCPYYNDQNGK